MSPKPTQQSSRSPIVDVENLSRSEDDKSVTSTGDEKQSSGNSINGLTDTAAEPIRSRAGSLDSIFYIICALAGLGLVGSLYALISQNNAYFDREFAQLQKETAALNARLAAVNDVELNVLPADAAAEVDLIEQSAPPQDPVLDGGIVTEEVEQEAVVLAPEVKEVPVEADDAVSPADTVVSTSLAESLQEIGTLRAELQMLREVVYSQEQQIRQLLDQSSTPEGAASVSRQAPVKVTDSAEDKTPVDPSIAEPAVVTLTENNGPGLTAVERPTAGQQNADSRMADAYLAYQEMRYESALRIYQTIVQFDPYHRDASLGVAASAYQLGDFALAEQLYRHLLSMDSLDSSAFAGLLGLVRQNPQRSIIELELQQHADHHGSPAVLTSLLGNHFARLGRWRDAETAFSHALRGQSGNADLLFNYAVVLDNLGLQQRAVQYYQSALEASISGAHSFDNESVKTRLDALMSG